MTATGKTDMKKVDELIDKWQIIQVEIAIKVAFHRDVRRCKTLRSNVM